MTEGIQHGSADLPPHAAEEIPVVNRTLIIKITAAASIAAICCAARAESAKRGEDMNAEREKMVGQLRAYGVKDPEVLRAMAKIRRHAFIPTSHRNMRDAYGDHPCPIGHGQTISQPYIVAYMTEKLRPQKSEKILEIGTGSGYQAAVLAELGATVFSIEIIPALARHARAALDAEGYAQVKVLEGDGYKGWPEHAPFDAIIVTCAPENVPQALVEQLREGGRMILPVGPQGDQRLVILRKKSGQTHREDDLPVRFVPMVQGSEPAARED